MHGRIIRRKIKGEKIRGSFTIVLELGRDDQTGKYRQKWIAVKGKRPGRGRQNDRANAASSITLAFLEDTKLTTGEFLRQVDNFIAKENWTSDHTSATSKLSGPISYRISAASSIG